MLATGGDKIALIAHDAGGSEFWAAWIKRHPSLDIRYYLTGSAAAVFQRELGLSIESKNLEAFLRSEKWQTIWTTANWGSDSDLRAWRYGRDQNIETIAFADCLGSTEDCFMFEEEEILPSKFWCTTSDVKKALIGLRVHAEKIDLVPAYHFQEKAQRIRKFEAGEKADMSSMRILYICENISECEKNLGAQKNELRGYDEFSALDYFLQKVRGGLFAGSHVRVRPHPSDAAGKYDGLLKNFSDLHVDVSKDHTLEKDIAWSNTVVGCESQALMIALEAGRLVYSCLPPEARTPCRLSDRRIHFIVSSGDKT